MNTIYIIDGTDSAQESVDLVDRLLSIEERVLLIDAHPSQKAFKSMEFKKCDAAVCLLNDEKGFRALCRTIEWRHDACVVVNVDTSDELQFSDYRHLVDDLCAKQNRDIVCDERASKVVLS